MGIGDVYLWGMCGRLYYPIYRLMGPASTSPGQDTEVTYRPSIPNTSPGNEMFKSRSVLRTSMIIQAENSVLELCAGHRHAAGALKL